MKLWVDDLRDPPHGWKCVRTVSDAIKTLEKTVPELLSLDYNMGRDRMGQAHPTGLELVDWIIRRQIPVPKIYLHSSDSAAAWEMKKRLDKARAQGILPAELVTRVGFPD